MERRIAQNKKTEQEKRMREMAQNARLARTQALRKAEEESVSKSCKRKSFLLFF
jgi:hypothetical protein